MLVFALLPDTYPCLFPSQFCSGVSGVGLLAPSSSSLNDTGVCLVPPLHLSPQIPDACYLESKSMADLSMLKRLLNLQTGFLRYLFGFQATQSQGQNWLTWLSF